MSGTLANIAAMSVTGTPGTGTITLNAAVQSYITFANAGVVDGDIVTYMALDGTDREIGTATYTSSGTTLSSRSVLNSTNSNAAVSLTSAAKIYLTAAAQDLTAGAMQPKLKRPRLADFTARNSASASTNANGGTYLSAPVSATDNLRYYDMNVPSTPYTITAFILPNLPAVQYLFTGLCWNDGTKLLTFGIDSGSAINENAITCRDWTNATTHSADNRLLTHYWASGVWLKIADTGANRTTSYSMDGYNFRTHFTEASGTFLTPTKVGFFCNTRNTTWEASMTMLSWEQT